MRVSPIVCSLLLASVAWAGGQNPANSSRQGLTIFDSGGRSDALVLRTIDPGVDPSACAGPPQTQCSSKLSPANASFVGLELQIPFGEEKPTVGPPEEPKQTH